MRFQDKRSRFLRYGKRKREKAIDSCPESWSVQRVAEIGFVVQLTIGRIKKVGARRIELCKDLRIDLCGAERSDKISSTKN